MTVSAASTAPPTDEELLIQEALRQRRRQRTGRSLAGALALAVFFAVAGFVVTAVSGAVPGEAWGERLPGDCPACGKPALRSGEVTVWAASTLNVVAVGSVTLCETPGCPPGPAGR